MNKAEYSRILLAASQKIKERDYWLNKLSGELEKSYFPLDHRTGQNEKRTGKIMFQFPWQWFSNVIKVSKGADLKIHVLLAAGLGVLLHKYTGNRDIVIGTPMYKQKIEMDFVNTVLILRSYIKENMTFRELLLEMKQTIVEAIENRNYPVEILPEILNKPYSLNDDFPLFDVTVLIQNIHDKEYLRHIKHNMTFSFLRTGEDIKGEVEYNALLYKKATVEQIIKHFNQLLRDALLNPEIKVSNIDILTMEEKKQVLVAFNGIEAEYPQSKVIHELFAEQAEKTPDNIAVVSREYGVWGTAALSYRELNKKSNQLAHRLREKGVIFDTVVGIMAGRSKEMIIGILAILKAGGAYLPIDPGYPEDRIDYMLADSNARMLLSEVSELGTEDAETTHLTHPTQLCYVIYTSGSTGKPKGVMIEHRSVVNIIFSLFKYYPFSADDTYLLKTPYLFDVSVSELFGWFLGGGRLAILENEAEKDPQKISDAVERMSVTHINFVPSMFGVFVDWLSSSSQILRQLTSLKYIFLAGEALLPAAVNKFRELNSNIQLENIYGPTESTVYATKYSLACWNGKGSIPIGHPLMNIKAYILNIDGGLQPIGTAGELCLAGLGLARGYLNQPELTAEKFISISYKSYRTYRTYISQKIYKTGDLARWLRGGNIEFLGRIDQQVKIRGFRVELGEIENQLLKHPEIKETVALCRGYDVKGMPIDSEDKYLCAYIVGHNNKVNAEGLREYLSHALPDYMIPSYFIPIEEVPLTPSGKIDRSALPLPLPGIASGAAYAAPRNKIEEKLVEIWSEILSIDPLPESPDRAQARTSIGIDDNFFALGGHSLKAIALLSIVHKEFNVKIPLLKLFKIPTIRKLFDYIEESAEDRFVTIKPIELKEYYILSAAQKRLYILHHMEIESTAYNIPGVIPLPGEFDIVKLEETFKKLVERHESFRTSFHMIADEPVQKIHEEVEFEIEYFSVEQRAESVELPYALRSTLYADIIQDFVRPFDLSRAPLLRVVLIGIENKTHLLLIDMHHIISDGTSYNLMVKNFMAIHEGRELSPLRLQYKDFCQWQNSEKERENLKQQEAYWLREFAGEIPVLDIPTDHARPAIQRFEGNTISFEISGDKTRVLKAMALEEKATLYMVLMANFNILLSILSTREDMVIGTPTAGRRHVDLEPVIGMFVNTLAIRNYPNGNKTSREFLAEVKERTLEAFENQEFQFEDLVEKVAVNRDAGRNPLFDVMFTLNNIDEFFTDTGSPADEGAPRRTTGLETGPHRYHLRIASKFDMTLNAVDSGEKLLFNFIYNTSLFNKDTIHRFAGYFNNILSTITAKKDIKLSQIEVMPKEEKKQVLYDFNNTGYGKGYPAEKTIHQLFEEQTARAPGNIAVVGIDRHLTYREINEKSNRLAWLLQAKGIGPGDIAAIMTGPDMEMIVAILAVLKSGACYLPIDPANPRERINYLLTDSNARILLSEVSELSEVSGGTEVIDLSSFILENEDIEPTHLTHPTHPTHLCYVLYTSGTTGKPKGVLVTHENLVNYVAWFSSAACLTPGDKALLTSSFAFDLGYTSIYPSLLKGGQLHIVPKETYMLPGTLLEHIHRQGVTYLKMTPSLFSVFVADPGFSMETCRYLRLVVLGGEAVNTGDVEKAYRICKHLRIMNHYGPTEVTIGCIAQFIDINNLETYKSRPTIGKPIYNTKAFILDRYLNVLPVGIAGELCLSGAGVARGYFKRDALTAEKFIDNSFMKREETAPPYHRVYRTGDRARWLPGGNIEFLGRMDHQVKIRGYRIELGEIESQLTDHIEIKDAVVLTGINDSGNTFLCAYIVPQTVGSFPDASELKEYLSRWLPDYMIPGYFIRMETIPLTPNGKIDRKALPEPEMKAGEGYVTPRNEIEKKLVEIWWEVLVGRNVLSTSSTYAPISIDDNFFQLGGNSLRAVIMISKVHKALDVKVPMAEVFKTPTIMGLAEYVEKSVKKKYTSIEPVEKKEYYPLSSPQKRLYILQQMEGDSTAYNMPRIIPLEGVPDERVLNHVIKQLINRHESLRTSFHLVSDEPVQKIHEEVEFAVEHFDISKVEGGRQDWDFIRPFDLSRAPLLRVGLTKRGESEYILLVDTYHIIYDGISHHVLVRDFMALYRRVELSPLRIQYKDFAQWQNNEKETGNMQQQEAYWLRKFSGEVPVLDLPVDYMRPAVQSFEGDIIHFGISAEDTGALQAVAFSEGSTATIYMVLLAVFTILLAKLSGQEDIVVGSAIAGRRHADLEKIIGMFVNTLVLRNYPNGEKTFKEFLREVKVRTLEAFENQDYPFEELVEKVSANVKRDPGRNPLFDVVFALQNIEAVSTDTDVSPHLPRADEAYAEQIPGPAMEHYRYIDPTSKFDFALIGTNVGKILLFSLQYCTKLFKKETVERFIDYFKKIVSLIGEKPGIKLKQIELISEEEKKDILVNFNRTRAYADYPGDKTIHALFEEQAARTPDKVVLGEKRTGEAEQFTYRQLNARSNQLAAVLREKAIIPETIVTLLLQRPIEMIIGTIGVLKAGGAFILLEPGIPRWRMDYILKDSGCQMVVTDKNGSTRVPGKIHLSIPDINDNPGAFAAVSPGNPEPVSKPGDLACVVYESGPNGFPRGLVIEHRDLVNLVKPVKRGYSGDCRWSKFLSPSLSIDAFLEELSRYNYYVLDFYRNVLPIGVNGEIYIRVCRGYLNRPGLTAEKFIKNPFDDAPQDIFYRTGDMGRYLPDGNIKFMGRRDKQLKIKGYRIEPDEIRFHMLNFAGVKDAVVAANLDSDFDGNDGEAVLTAYYVKSSTDAAVDVKELKTFLSRRLPAYMVPVNFIQLEKLPLNSKGRIDLSALPGPVVGPGNEIERKLAVIWSKILGEDNIDVSSDFFQLGGNSIKALLLVSEINQAFNVTLLLTDIFEWMTIEKLARFLSDIIPGSSAPAAIRAIEEQEYYDVSHAQRRLWVLGQFEEGLVAYNMSAGYILEGPLNPGALGKTFEMLADRHEVLRTVFITVDGVPKQKILSKEKIGFTFKQIDLRKDPHWEERVKALTEREGKRVYDLDKGPLVIPKLIRLEDEKFLFLLNMHHIISDGWSMGIMIKEVCLLYNTVIDDEGSSLLPLTIQYKDFSAWQNKQLAGEELSNHREYWLSQFRGDVPVLELPCDYPRPKVKTYNGAKIGFTLPAALSRGIVEFSKKRGTSLFITLLTSVAALLYRYTGQEDMVLGSPISGRVHSDLENQIGYYVNTLALRFVFNGSDSFECLLDQVKEACLAAYDHEVYPFDQLVDELELDRDTSRSPLFDVLVTLNPEIRDIPSQGMRGIQIEGYKLNPESSKFDLLAGFNRFSEDIYVMLEYNTDLFCRERIQQMSSHYQQLLTSIISDGKMPLNKLNYLSGAETHRLLVEFNDTEGDYPKGKTIHELFNRQVERTPDRLAVTGHGRMDAWMHEEVHITYRELNKRSGRLAHLLKEKGVLADNITAIMMKRSLEMIIGILGILKSGAAYLPIEPDYPGERIEFMLADSGARILLNELSKVSEECEVVDVSVGNRLACSTTEDRLHMSPAPATSLAYIIYTSGSTGKPKGVMIEHPSVVNIIFSLFKYYPFSVDDTYLFKTPYLFDVSVSELFGWFLGGGRLAILENEAEKDPQKILDTVERMSVTHINFVPSMFAAFVDWLSSSPQSPGQLSSLKYIFLAGETLLPVTVNKFRELDSNIRLENIYGPTESTVYAAKYSLACWDGVGSIPIGHPLMNIKAYILNSYGSLQPVGTAGELCLAGLGLARGYMNRPELTAEKFFSISQKIYKTGDLARWLWDGNIEFLGRTDYQVKIRGYRVELEEIENQLLKHHDIKEAVVLAKEDEKGNNYLCAYIVSGKEFTVPQLRRVLSKNLPDYMLPSWFMPLKELPLTPNGKLDRKSLPEPEGGGIQGAYVPPRGLVEEKLVEIWSDVLLIEKAVIGTEHNFFELGGHSLKAITMVSRLHKEFNVKLPLAVLFKTPTIRALSRYIKESTEDKYTWIEPTENKEYYPLSSAQKRFYILQQIDIESTAYNMPIIIKLEGHLVREKFETVFKKLIDRHESLRTSFELVNGEPVQRIHEKVYFAARYFDSSGSEPGKIVENFVKSFDLAKAPLLRLGFIKITEKEHILMFDMHHIITDGTSMGIFINDLLAFYAGREPAPLRLQNKDFSQWQHELLTSGKLKKQQDYWLDYFSGELPVLNLPYDYPRPPVQSFDGDSIGFHFETELSRKLKGLIKESGTTLYMMLLALYNILLSKYIKRKDIIIGTPAAGRNHPDLENIIGLLLETIVTRNYPEGDKTFAEFLDEVKENTLNAYENQSYPFGEIIKQMGVENENDRSRNPLFDVMLVVQNIDTRLENPGIGELKIVPYEGTSHKVSKVDLTLEAVENEEGITFNLEYCTKLFKRETIERFITFFREIASVVVENKKIRLKDIGISHDLILASANVYEDVESEFEF